MTESKFRAIIVTNLSERSRLQLRITIITMAIGSAVRSVRYESSVGEEAMVVDQRPMAVDQEATGIQQRHAEDGAGQVADDDEYEYPEEVQAPGKSRKDATDDVPFNRALPVAELPDDFDGETLDGATFLALSK